MLALVACTALLALDPPTPPPASPRDYNEARERAGRTPDDQVRLALWCEAHGLAAERLKHLAMAVMADPGHPAARGLMGLVEHGGRWRRPEAVADEVKADPTLAEYDARRRRAAYTAEAQYALGVWCDDHGLKDQARAHLTAVVRLDPARDLAWKRLGYKRHDGRWATDARLAAEQAEAEAQKQADKRWKPLLEKWRGMLAQPSRREEARAELLNVTDPRALPMISQVFLRGDRAADVSRAVQLLGQVDSPRSSKVLASLAVAARSAEDRRAATEILRGRDPREFARVLIDRFEAPIPYEVRPVAGPGSPGALTVQGKQVDLRRLYSPPPAPAVATASGDSRALDADGLPVIERPLIDLRQLALAGMERDQASARALDAANRHRWGPLAGPPAGPVDSLLAQDLQPVPDPRQVAAAQLKVRIPVGRMMAEADNAARSAQDQLARDVAALDRHNGAVRASNERIAQALNDVTGQSLAADSKTWNAWWVDQLGFRARAITAAPPERPTLIEEVPLDFTPREVPVDVTVTPSVGSPFGPWGSGGIDWMSRITSQYKVMFHSCFGAGTPVRTVDGIRPIESLKVGDRVLTQDVGTGALGYRPVLVVHHNPPIVTFRVQVAGETIVSSPFHRFWVAGRGWVMARALKPGDSIRTLGGVAPVESIEPGPVQPVFNLDVAEDADFFAGKLGALVHDNSLPDPRLAPFDALPSIKAGAASAR